MKLIKDVKDMYKQVLQIQTLFIFPTQTVRNPEFLDGIIDSLGDLRDLAEECRYSAQLLMWENSARERSEDV